MPVSIVGIMEISTHAPRTGSDPARRRRKLLPANFNPRSPHGERPKCTCAKCGAKFISTHAPRTGSDVYINERNTPIFVFQPTLPARGATIFYCTTFCDRTISTHAPRTGSDRPPPPLETDTQAISTHAPRTGSDQGQTHTHRLANQFQPTLPARGATSACRACPEHQAHFNPRSPHGERRRRSTNKRGQFIISTHAPRTGSDRAGWDYNDLLTKFQPTLPARGATAQSNNSVDQNHRLCTKSIP